jgi:multidrug efflux system membrane fusion protein
MDEKVAPARTQPLRPTKQRTPEPSPPRRRRGRRTLFLLALIAGGVLLRLHPWTEVTQPGPAPTPGRAGRTAAPPQAIRTADAAVGDIPIVLNALGTTTSLATVTIRTQISGQLQQVAFREGQTVKAGDFLAQIDPRPYQAALDQAQGQMAKDSALLAQAQADLARFQILTRQDSISRQQVDDQQFLVHQDQAAITTDRAQIDSAKLNLAYCRIVSPIDGRVGLRQVDQGNYVQASDANGIVVITKFQPISVIFSIPEDSLPAVMKRIKAAATLTATAYDRSNTTQIATGTLATTDNQIDTTTGTIKLRASFSNEDETLFPNQFVNVQLLVDTLTGATLVPNAALQQGTPGSFVYVVNEDSTVAVRPVKTGPADASRTSVLSGLSPGEKVVIDGADRLRDGAKVEVRNGEEPTTPQPSPPREHRRRRNGTGGQSQ